METALTGQSNEWRGRPVEQCARWQSLEIALANAICYQCQCLAAIAGAQRYLEVLWTWHPPRSPSSHPPSACPSADVPPNGLG